MPIALLLTMGKVYTPQIKMLNSSELHFSSQQDVVLNSSRGNYDEFLKHEKLL